MSLAERLERLSARERRILGADWQMLAHEGQTAPQGDWGTWLILGGRGGGKTRAGAEWVADQAGRGASIALVGQSLHDVREVMIEGASGIRALPRWRLGGRPRWEASRRRLVWSNGAVATAFSAEDPESLRGPQFTAAWADEWCAWPRARGGPEATLALLRMGLRLGDRPRLVITTTPRPTGALRRLVTQPGVVRSDLPTRGNANHLAPSFLDSLEAQYGGTRLAAQELEGRIVEGDGALFTLEMMRGARSGALPERFERIVVAVDPSCSSGGDACGIVVVGRTQGLCWVLADRTVRGRSPQGWAGAVARAVDDFGASRVVAEANQGGEMVEAVLRTAGVTCAVRRVHARTGKRTRAEPVAALYEQNRVRHVAGLEALEEELMGLGSEDGGQTGASPDRADALVWAVTDLLVTPPPEGPRISVL